MIPAFNEERYIGNVFKGLKSQSFKDFEVIVSDGNSTDRTRAMARKHGKVVTEPIRNIGVARNTGVKHARGEIIFFTNADTRPTKDLFRTYNELFKDKSVVAAPGRWCLSRRPRLS